LSGIAPLVWLSCNGQHFNPKRSGELLQLSIAFALMDLALTATMALSFCTAVSMGFALYYVHGGSVVVWSCIRSEDNDSTQQLRLWGIRCMTDPGVAH
jgi:hypothetical protein